MFRELMQKLMGTPAPVEEQVESEQPHQEIHEERIEPTTGMGDDPGVMPGGEGTDSDADREVPT